MLGTRMTFAFLLVATYMSLFDESSSLGMWGDFSMHAERARALAKAGDGSGAWRQVSELTSNVNCSVGGCVVENKEKRVNSRKRRYVTFPSGSSSSLAICLSLGVPDTNLIFTHGLGYGISFELPNDTKILRGGKEEGGPPEASSREMGRSFVDSNGNFPAKRRDRRTLYRRIETALEVFGLDGKECVLRTLCEVAQRMTPKGSLMEEFVRIVFTMPQLKRPHSWEGWDWDEEQSKDYDEAHLKGRNGQGMDCSDHYPGCELSLLQFLIR